MSKLTALMRRKDGPLTRDLALTPGGFGLGKVPARLAPDATTTMVCGYCSTGCGLSVHLAGGRAVNLSPATHYPVNRGMACPKGWEALAALAAPDRATQPLLRDDRGKLVPVSWHQALTAFTDRFKAIQARHGNESVAFLGTGQLPSEELAFLGSLAKHGMGMRHGDGNTRQCMATAVVAYKQAFGFDAPPYSYEDFDESDVIVLWGSNLCVAHPIMWQRIITSKRRPTVIVVDPRATETAMAAAQHLALRPKSDLYLLYGLARLLIERDLVDHDYIRDHTTGFAELSAFVSRFDMDTVAGATGLAPAAIETLAVTIGSSRRASLWWTMGVNQSHEGVRTAQGIINLALLTGNIGRPGTGANSITGQCNAMGSRLFSNTTNLLGGHDFAAAADRSKVAGILGIDEDRIPRDPGWSYDQIMSGILGGTIKGLWVVATNTAHSWINQNDAKDILGRLDFLVVQDMYTSTETAQRADLILPAAAWGEKLGTFINSERRIGLVKRVSPSPGQALADFSIFKLIAQYWGVADMFAAWTDPEAVFGLLQELTRGQPCDISGIDGYRMLDESGGVQWPCPQGTAPGGSRRLFTDGRYFHPDGKARFLFEEPRPLPEAPSRVLPFLLITGRGSSAEWHTRTRTGKSAVLGTLGPRDPYIELSPGDADRLTIKPNQWVKVISARGSMVARAFVTHTVQPGQVFVSMHHPDTNQLTFASFDPYSRQPSYKACAVDVRRLDDYTGNPPAAVVLDTK